MPNHSGFLERLWEAFPHQVYLTGKFADPELGLPEDNTLRVFIPDLHWMSVAALERYPRGYGFTGNNFLPNGKPLFGTLLDVLEDVRDQDVQSGNGGLEVFQLGDAYDLWREMAREEKDAKNAYRRVRQDPILGNLADRLDDLSVNYVTGNHDHWLPQVIPSGPTAPKVKKEWSTAGGKIRLTHGHAYDPLEMGLPDDVQAAIVRVWTNLKPSKHGIGVFSKKSTNRIQMVFNLRQRPGFRKDFYPTVEPDGAYPIENIADIQNAESKYKTYLDVSGFSKMPGSANDFDHVSYLRFADQIVADELSHEQDHSVHVIGHTHGARLLVDRIPPNRPHVTLDCGSWIGLCNVLFKGKTDAISVPSAQIGVQCGNDIRIYQLGGLG